MFKTIALLKRKPGLSRAEFIDYYENHHVPLIRELQPQIREYRRNFIELDGAYLFPGAEAPDFDVITEMWYDDRDAYDAAMAVWSDPAMVERRVRDESNFIDIDRIRFFIVEERCST
jgi:uncharacterized protein (TIGR02118 family)